MVGVQQNPPFVAKLTLVMCMVITMTSCIFPIPERLLKNPTDSLELDSTDTDREIVELLPHDVALDHLKSQAKNPNCGFNEHGVMLTNNQTYDYARFMVNEVKLTNQSEGFTVFLFASDASQTQGLVCSWQGLSSEQSEKLLTSLASLGVQYR